MLARFQMDQAKPADTPLNPSLPLVKAKLHDKRMDIQTYQELTGSLNHAAVFSRPDIAFAVSKLSQFNSDPTETHMKAARRVLAYLKAPLITALCTGMQATMISTRIQGHFIQIRFLDLLMQIMLRTRMI